MYVTRKPAGTTGQISLFLRIDNQTSQSVDLSTVTLRYWYQDEGWNTTSLMPAIDYESISGDNVTNCKAFAASSPVPGADHYLELSFSGTLAAKGAPSGNDQFTVNVRPHNTSWQGTVDVTNDYSYNGGATEYDDKITLHDGSGNVIWGVLPGVSPAGSADAGVDASVSEDDSGGQSTRCLSHSPFTPPVKSPSRTSRPRRTRRPGQRIGSPQPVDSDVLRDRLELRIPGDELGVVLLAESGGEAVGVGHSVRGLVDGCLPGKGQVITDTDDLYG